MLKAIHARSIICPRLCFSIIHLIFSIIVTCSFSEVFAQEDDLDKFPRLFIEANSGMIKPIQNIFSMDYINEPIYGAQAGIEAFSPHPRFAVYTVSQYHTFRTQENIAFSKTGFGFLQYYNYNIGFRLNMTVPFIDRDYARIYIGAGFAQITAERFSEIIESKIERTGWGTELVNKIVGKEILNRWRSNGYYVELGQVIPFELSDTPNFAFNWALKYGQGTNPAFELSNVFIRIGISFAFWYSELPDDYGEL